MRALHRKLLRDLRRHWMQVTSIALVMACGAMTIIGLRSTVASVRGSRDRYYEANRFADLFASVQRAPSTLAARVAAIPGIGAVEPHIVRDVALHVPGLAMSAVGRAVSVPERERSTLDQVHVRRGRWIEPGRSDEVMVSERFAELNHLLPGDTLGAVVNGRWQRLRVVGIALSPAFVIETAGGVFMDNRRFGVLWMSRRGLETAFDMRGAFNNLAVRLAPGADADAVTAALDRLLAPWGSTGVYGREDQPSARVLADEFSQLDTYATVFPSFFLIVGAFLLNVVLSRLVAAEREEIAALKAFGYTDREVGAHYLSFAVAAVLLGAALGVPAGIWMGRAFTHLYATYFRFPELRPVVDPWGLALGVGVSGGIALLGAIGAVRRAVALPSAEAMRPESPVRVRRLLVEMLGLGRLVSPSSRMVLRNLERRPLRTASGILGVALALALLAAGRYPYDAVARLMSVQFGRAQHEDLTAMFTQARPERAAAELAHVPGVVRVEPFRSVPVRLRHGAAMRTTTITGTDAGGTLRRLVDVHGVSHAPPIRGAAITAGLARRLGVRAGDTVVAELLLEGGRRRAIVVAGVFDQMIGAGAYMDRRALGQLLRDDDAISGAYLSAERGAEDAVAASLEEMPGVIGSVSRRAMIRTIDEQMQQSMSLVMPFVVVSAALIALGVLYNAARIAVSERGRELASLRVLGFTRGEVSRMLVGEQGVTTAAALPVGVLCGLAFTLVLARAFTGHDFKFPYTAEVRTYLFAAGVVVGATALSAFVIGRLVRRLDLVAALKTRE